ncbi:DUF2177 family protein [Acholeplasma hippikon]|nr:DUF2177 family protein [Acholeplasma hippikon]
MLIYIKVFVIAFLIFLAVDLIWLGVIANKLYQNEMGHLMKKNLNFVAAFLFYAIFIVGLSVFVIIPSIESGSLIKVVLLGALFGFVSYATYDLTNYATLEGFPLKMVVIDLIWGTSLGTLTSLLTFLIYRGVFK